MVPEWWTFTTWVMITLGASVVGLALVAIAIYQCKYNDCFSELRINYHEYQGCEKYFRFLIQHIIPSVLVIGTCVTDIWYILKVPVANIYMAIFFQVTIWLQFVIYFFYSYLHSLDKTSGFCQFAKQFIQRFVLYSIG